MAWSVTARCDYDPSVPGDETFADVLAANAAYACSFPHNGLEARAAQGLAVLTCERVMLIAHTDCRMTRREDELHAAVRDAGGPDTRDFVFLAAEDQEATVRADVELLRSSPYLTRVRVGGFRYDVETGRLNELT